MYKYLLSVIFILMAFTSAAAQELSAGTDTTDIAEPEPECIVNLYDNSAGLVLSSLSGSGICYTRRFFDSYAVSISTFLTYDENTRWKDMSKSAIESEHNNTFFDVGVEIQRDIIVLSETKIYVLVGGYYYSDKNVSGGVRNIEKNYTVGLGFGLQWALFKQGAGYVHFGYKFDKSDLIEGNQPSVSKETNVGLGIGVAFFF